MKPHTDVDIIEAERRCDAALILMQREIDNLRAEVKSQTTRLVALRPMQESGLPAWAAAFERRLDVLAAELARLQSLLPTIRAKRRA